MALVKPDSKTGQPAGAAPAKAPAAPVDEPTMVLELALYQNYTHKTFTYTKGKPYRFKQSDALKLLAMRDFERPVWKQYHPPPPKRTLRNQVEDRSEAAAPITPIDEDTVLDPQELQGIDLNPDAAKRFEEIGNEDEISDILSRKDDTSGDQTV